MMAFLSTPGRRRAQASVSNDNSVGSVMPYLNLVEKNSATLGKNPGKPRHFVANDAVDLPNSTAFMHLLNLSGNKTFEKTAYIVHDISITSKDNSPRSYLDDIAADAEKMAKIAAVSKELAADLRAGRIFIGNAEGAFNDASQAPFRSQAAPEVSEWEIARREKLPQKAILYSEGKRHSESVFDYYQRVWQPYIEAGVLYRDDIPRLGDDQILKVIRTHCVRHGIDVDAVMPKKVAERVKDELAASAPDSLDAMSLKRRLLQRERTAKFRLQRST